MKKVSLIVALTVLVFAPACSGGGGGGTGTTTGPAPPVNNPPNATITAPVSGTTIEEGESVTLQGRAEDPEDGDLGGASLRWDSHIDGRLGTGRELTVTELSLGTHTITLTAVDGNGAEGRDETTLQKVRSNSTGARNWVAQNSGTSDVLVNIVFVDPNTGWAINQKPENTAPLLLSTSDGGTTWDSRTVLTSDSRDIGELFGFFDQDIGFMGGQNCVLLRTDDGGETWTQEKICDSDNWILTIHFVDARTMWIGGGEGLLLKSTDGGESWEGVDIDLGVPVNGIHFVNPQIGVLVSGAGVFRTTDGGETWTQQSSEGLLDVHFIDSDTGIAVGWDGVILRTTDSGASWTQIDGGASNVLTSVDFGTDGFGVAVGLDLILVTTDGGASWQRETSGARRELTAVTVLNAGNAWASGAFGTILARDPQ